MRRGAIVAVVGLVACGEADRAAAPPGGGPTQGLVAPTPVDVDRAAPVRAPAVSRLGGAVTSIDPRRGAHRFVWTREPAPTSLVVTAAHRARGATTAAGVAALAHLERNAERWGLDAAALATAEVAHVHDLGRGAIVVRLRQRVRGVPVARTSLAIVMDRALGLVALAGGLHPAARGDAAIATQLPAEVALGLAADDAHAARPVLARAPTRSGFERFTAPGLAGHARARRVLFPVGTTLVSAWETELPLLQGKRIAGYRHVFADDGRLLFRTGLSHDAAFSYRVWADATGDLRFQDGPQGDYTPHPTGQPDGFDPPFVPPALVTLDGFNAPGDPWLADGATSTQGNNVDAYADLDFQSGFTPGDVRPTTTAPGVFDRVYDVTAEPAASTDQQMAAVTQLFYVNNWLHDYWYDSGFTEAAGNAQVSNLGRGGVEEDVLLAEGQDASGTDNANMFTPADGASPVMQMFVFTAPADGPRRDGTLDNHIVAHEWGHYFHHRLVECGSVECASMSEGWGDFSALFASVRATDDLAGTWGMGAYPLRAYTPNSAYFGIRRYPYSTTFAKNPLTFRFVERGVPLPAGVPSSDIGFLQNSDNWEVHNSGEIWCSMLWEGTVELLRQSRPPASRYSFDEARRRMADYLVAGMLATPVEPTYTEQRDAILAAAAAADPLDFQLLATAFARRGFGTGAVSPPVDSFDGSGVVESFVVTGALDLVAATLEDDPASCDGDGLLDVGETGVVRVVVRNAGAATLTGPTVSVASSSPGIVFPSGTTAALAPIAPGATREATIAVRLDETPVLSNAIELELAAQDPSAAIATASRAASALANADITPAVVAIDTFETPELAWTASAGGFGLAFDAQSSHVAAVTVAASGDHTLQTPALQVSATESFTITFRHRHRFGGGSEPLDGGVIELSTDGVDFADLTALVPPALAGYGPAITGTGNPLAGRAAYTGTNASHPGFDTVTIDLGTQLAGQTVFVRFRAGGDTLADLSRWELDDVAFGGLDNTPFPLLTVETGSCLPGQRPIANAGAALSVDAGDSGALDGSASIDPDGGALAFEWTQVFGPTLALSSRTIPQPSFVAPDTEGTRVARFQLVVRDPDGRVSAPAFVNVSVVGASAPDAGADGAPDAGVDAGTEVVPDAGELPDAPGNPLAGEGGGCCDSGRDPRGSWLLALVLALAWRRRRAA